MTSLARRCPRCGSLYPHDGPHTCAGATLPEPAPGYRAPLPTADTLSATGLGTTDTLDATGAGLGMASTLDGSSAPSASAPAPVVSVKERRADALDDLVGAILGERYEICERLSQGGMGVVFRARHVVLDSTLAVKFLLRPQDEEARQRFLQEAKLASQISHPNTVNIADFGVLKDGVSYLVMEFLRGPTLSKVLKTEQRLDPLRACHVALQVARGLSAVHARGIVHRDLKPDNVFLIDAGGSGAEGRDFVKIVDFGIALRTGQAPPDGAPSGGAALASDGADTGAARLTQPGALLGTPHYMAPEQARGVAVDARADQYALGCMFYEMLTGDVPFDGGGVMTILTRHISETPVPLRRRAPGLRLSEELDALVMRLLAKEPAQRFASMSEVEQAIEREITRLQEERSPRRAKGLGARPWVLGSILLLGLAGGYGAVRLLAPKPAAQHQVSAAELLALRQRAVSLLQKDLQDPSAAVRRSALQGLGTARAASTCAAIEPLLRDADQEVQAQAALALGLLGERSSLGVLREALERASLPNVRAAIAAALEQLGEAKGSEVLVAALADPSEELRRRAAYLLCDRGDAKALAILGELAERLPPAEVLPVLGRLARCGSTTARDRLRAALRGPAESSLQAAGLLADLGDEEGRAALMARAQRPGMEQLPAARLLASPSEPQGNALFRRILREPQPAPAALLLAVEGLGSSGERDDATLLERLLRPPGEPRLRHAAAVAILQLVAREPSAMAEQGVAWARSAAADRDWVARQAAAEVLGDSASPEAPVLLAKLLRDDDARVRRSAVRALGRQRNRASMDALRSSLHDTSGEVRRDALISLDRVASALLRAGASSLLSEVTGWLGETLRSGAPEEQLLGSALLFNLGDKSQRERLIGFLSIKEESLRLLAVQRVPAEAGLLAPVLKDEAYGVRFTAARRIVEFILPKQNSREPEGLKDVLREGLQKGGADAVAAYSLLQRLGEQGPQLVDLEAQIRSGDARARMAAVEACALLPPELAVAVLRTASLDPEPLVRQLVAEVAAELPKQGPRALGPPLLHKLAQDTDQRVRARALLLLSRILAPSSAAVPTSPTPVQRPGTGVGPVAASADGGATPDLAVATKTAPALEKEPEPAPLQAAPPAAGAPTEPVPVPDKGNTDAAGASPFFDKALKALAKKDTEKARKQLEKATALCLKAKTPGSGCAKLAYDGGLKLGSLFEQDSQWGEAMAEYDRLSARASALKLTSEQTSALAQAMKKMEPRVGRIVVPKQIRKKCQEVTIWMKTGTHQIEVNDDMQTVTVSAGQITRVGSCK